MPAWNRDRYQCQAESAGVAARDLGQGVDCRGEGLGLAGDVGDEGDRGAELAHAAGKGEDHAGDDAGESQRQGHHQKDPDRAGAVCGRRTLEPPVDRLDRQAYCAHHQRKAHHRAGECRTGPAKGEHDPEMLVAELAERAAAAEQQQVAVTTGDQRQVNHPVEQRFSPEPSACQHQRHENARFRLAVIAQSATRKLRCTAVASSGDRWSHSAISAITLISSRMTLRAVNPCFSKTAPAAGDLR